MIEPTKPMRPTRAEIDLRALRFNFRSVKAFIGDNVRYMGVVKANAYGHGAVECAKCLVSESVDWLAVALVEEGVELREAGITVPILCLGGFWPGQELELLRYDLVPVIFNLEHARSLDNAMSKLGTVLKVHLKIDTGMRRVGVPWTEIEKFAEELCSFDNIILDGVMTHFAVADDLEQNDFTFLQIERFNSSVQLLQDKGFTPQYVDMANSPGAIAHPASLGNMVRLGGVLYGLGGDVLPRGIEKPELRGVLSLRTKIAQVKQVPAGEALGYGRSFTTKRSSTIATIPVGYNDGYRRSLSNRANAIVRGELAPVVGRISMDWTLIDVTDIPGAKVGDEVTLIGSDGGSNIKAEHLAEIAETISYEITCGVGSRVPRVFNKQH